MRTTLFICLLCTYELFTSGVTAQDYSPQLQSANLTHSVIEPTGPRADLVIVGGGLKSNTDDVWDAFIQAQRLKRPFIIIPSASGRPARSAQAVKETLKSYGVPEVEIYTAPLAVMDDQATETVNESEWSENIDHPEVISRLRSSGAIWFTGGDQSRTTRLFLDQNGDKTPALRAIEHARADGAVIGGTSAGAAIMSEYMITQGDSLTALTQSDQGEPVDYAAGLGFLSSGVVDQHFGERARLGRLAVTLGNMTQHKHKIGYGIDENTALITMHDGTFTVAGSGYVTILDARNATFDGFHIKGLIVHLMASEDIFYPTKNKVIPAQWKNPTVDNEYNTKAALGGGGMALPSQSLADVIGDALIDTADAKQVERISFNDHGQGVIYRFTQNEKSQGFWGRNSNGDSYYTVTNINFDIEPVTVKVSEFKSEP